MTDWYWSFPLIQSHGVAYSQMKTHTPVGRLLLVGIFNTILINKIRPRREWSEIFVKRRKNDKIILWSP